MLQTTVCAPHGARVAWALGNGYVELPRPEKDKRSSAADVVQPDLNIRKTDRQNQKKTCSSDQTLAAALREQPVLVGPPVFSAARPAPILKYERELPPQL